MARPLSIRGQGPCPAVVEDHDAPDKSSSPVEGGHRGVPAARPPAGAALRRLLARGKGEGPFDRLEAGACDAVLALVLNASLCRVSCPFPGLKPATAPGACHPYARYLSPPRLSGASPCARTIQWPCPTGRRRPIWRSQDGETMRDCRSGAEARHAQLRHAVCAN